MLTYVHGWRGKIVKLRWGRHPKARLHILRCLKCRQKAQVWVIYFILQGSAFHTMLHFIRRQDEWKEFVTLKGCNAALFWNSGLIWLVTDDRLLNSVLSSDILDLKLVNISQLSWRVRRGNNHVLRSSIWQNSVNNILSVVYTICI